MPPKAQRRVTLSAGEDCTITGSGSVVVMLLSGVVDITGVVLTANQPYTFYLGPLRRLVLYTLEGGSASITSDYALDLHKGVTGAAAVVQFVRRTLLPLARSKVLVIGSAQSGKTLSAHSVANLLVRHRSDVESKSNKVFLMDLNAESNALYGPGCLSVVPVTELPLWLGNTAHPSMLPLSLYTASAARPDGKAVSTFLHFVEQLHDTAVAYMEEVVSAGHSGHIVMDAPSPQADLKEGVFYKKLIELTRPTHVLIVGSRDDASDTWSTFLQEDVQRVLPDCEFSFLKPVNRPVPQPPQSELLLEYFVGTPYAPLGCSKVVVPVQALQVVEYLATKSSSTGLEVRKTALNEGLRATVCAVSHAEMAEEVPLAPAMGLAVIAHVDEEHEEVVLLIPASEEPLQRRFLVVPRVSDRETLRLTDTQMAMIQESVAV